MPSDESREEFTGRVKIIKLPTGEAPEKMRRGFVELTLPCDSIIGYPKKGSERGAITHKVIDRERSSLGVFIPQCIAISLMKGHDPEAAAMWVKYGYPQPGEYFFFTMDEIEIISGVTYQRIVEVTEEMRGDPER